MSDASGLTEFQLEVAQLFFGLPASDGFLLGGGAGLLASGLTSRPTQDLDFFQPSRSVVAARDEFEAAATRRGWKVIRLRDHDHFVRLQISGDEVLIVDLCLDSPPVRPAARTMAGPTLAADELAGRKVVALFGRAEARDFADVHALLERYTKDELLSIAREIDDGFDDQVFAEMLESIARYPDSVIADVGASPPEVRESFADWARQLRS